MELQERGINDRPIALTPEEAPFEEDLSSSFHRLTRARVATGIGETSQAAHRQKSLHKRGMVRLGAFVAVTAAIRPLPGEKAFGQLFAVLVSQPQTKRGEKSETLLRGATPCSAIDRVDAALVIGAQQPRALLFPQGDQGKVALRVTHLRQQTQHPMCALPFLIGMKGNLPLFVTFCQQILGARSGWDGRSVGLRLWSLRVSAQRLHPSAPPQGRFGRLEQGDQQGRRDENGHQPSTAFPGASWLCAFQTFSCHVSKGSSASSGEEPFPSRRRLATFRPAIIPASRQLPAGRSKTFKVLLC
jgi:hypothetical protein